MARNLETSTNENSNVQEMGPRRSMRLNVTISGEAPPPQGSTMATTAVATTVATHDEVHSVTTMAQAVSSKLVVLSKAHSPSLITPSLR
ncbi:hypothetical protein ACFX13_036234 [Malus domestica]